MPSTNQASPDEATIFAQITQRVEAVRTKNADAVLSCYAPDVATFDLMEPLANLGIDAVRKRLVEWFASFDTPIDYQLRDLKLAVAGDVAFDHHFTRVRGTTKTGQSIDMWFRETMGYRWIDGHWKVTHQHSSVPLDMTSSKGRFDLVP